MKTKIKYDKNFQRACLVLMILTGAILLLYGILTLIDSVHPLDVGTLLAILISVSIASIPMFPLFLVLYLDATFFLKRLKKNGFKVPKNKKDYGDDLSRLPRTEIAENRYADDSRRAAIIALAVYVIVLICDMLFLHKWMQYEIDDAKVMFCLLMAFHLIFPAAAYSFYRQRDTQKFVDEVDIRTNGRKVRSSIMGAIGTLLVLAFLAFLSIMTADSMTKYVYKSRYGRYEKYLSDFQAAATMNVSSDDLHNGVWDAKITNTADGSNLSPHLYFDPVDGADHYMIYMVDESANNWVHWLATDIHENELFTGDNLSVYGNDPDFQYIGPYPPSGSGEHTYTVYVYAMQGHPDADLSMVKFNEKSFGGDILYYDFLNVTERGDELNKYGNVLAYGYISGVYGEK